MRINWLIAAAVVLVAIGVVASFVLGGNWWSFTIPVVLAALLLRADQERRDEGRTRR